MRDGHIIVNLATHRVQSFGFSDVAEKPRLVTNTGGAPDRHNSGVLVGRQVWHLAWIGKMHIMGHQHTGLCSRKRQLVLVRNSPIGTASRRAPGIDQSGTILAEIDSLTTAQRSCHAGRCTSNHEQYKESTQRGERLQRVILPAARCQPRTLLVAVRGVRYGVIRPERCEE